MKPKLLANVTETSNAGWLRRLVRPLVLGHIIVKLFEVMRKQIHACLISRIFPQGFCNNVAYRRSVWVLVFYGLILAPCALQARPIVSEPLDSINRISQDGNALLNENLRLVLPLVTLGTHIGGDIAEPVAAIPNTTADLAPTGKDVSKPTNHCARNEWDEILQALMAPAGCAFGWWAYGCYKKWHGKRYGVKWPNIRS